MKAQIVSTQDHDERMFIVFSEEGLGFKIQSTSDFPDSIIYWELSQKNLNSANLKKLFKSADFFDLLNRLHGESTGVIYYEVKGNEYQPVSSNPEELALELIKGVLKSGIDIKLNAAKNIERSATPSDKAKAVTAKNLAWATAKVAENVAFLEAYNAPGAAEARDLAKQKQDAAVKKVLAERIGAKFVDDRIIIM
jgi:hypothetical protein